MQILFLACLPFQLWSASSLPHGAAMPALFDRVVQGTAGLHFGPNTKAERLRERNSRVGVAQYSRRCCGRLKVGASADRVMSLANYE